MSLLLLEPVGGCAGDMTLAALLDLGVPLDAVASGLDRLGLPGWSLEVARAHKCGIWGTQVRVHVDESVHDRERSWVEIAQLIRGAGLPAGARELALHMFEKIAVAEAHVHGTTPAHVHFHEVGAIDSIVDLVGVAIALSELGVERIYSSPPPLGSGIVQSRHGPIPVPAPATLEILKGRTVRFFGKGERTTPTGAAILAAATEPGPPPAFAPERIAYGIGHADFDDAANVIRATLGSEGEPDELVELACNLDDATPQVLARAIEAALEAGALDAWVAPVTMKKGRPAHLLGVLAPARLRARIADVLLRETPTLGVRHHAVGRDELERRFDRVETPWGVVSVKVGHRAGAVLNVAPEWEECLRAAKAHGVPARVVREFALAAWLSSRPVEG